VIVNRVHPTITRSANRQPAPGADDAPADRLRNVRLRDDLEAPCFHWRMVVPLPVSLSFDDPLSPGYAARMLIGYCRVSTDDQKLDLQLDALRAAGCERTFRDKQGGAKADRPGLAAALKALGPGDTLVVWRLDRLGRSLPHLIDVIAELKARGVGFRSVTESIDTTTATGELVFHIFGALASFERRLIQERTRAGLSAAKARGRMGGRKRVLQGAKLEQARRLMATGSSATEVATALGVGRATLYRALSAA